ncbi:hypothetical protein CLAIMM_13741 [Cladophialophora immunda]|nr:hypothetical protein CLAIMM_13741 [Cladophialophora immunda]
MLRKLKSRSPSHRLYKVHWMTSKVCLRTKEIETEVKPCKILKMATAELNLFTVREIEVAEGEECCRDSCQDKVEESIVTAVDGMTSNAEVEDRKMIKRACERSTETCPSPTVCDVSELLSLTVFEKACKRWSRGQSHHTIINIGVGIGYLILKEEVTNFLENPRVSIVVVIGSNPRA